MWNSRKYTAMAVVGVGLAVAAATPASAQLLGLGGAYGYGGGCGSYAYAPVYGSAGGCGGYGAYGAAYGAAPAYAGVYSYGWPYGLIGDVGHYGAYGYAGPPRLWRLCPCAGHAATARIRSVRLAAFCEANCAGTRPIKAKEASACVRALVSPAGSKGAIASLPPLPLKQSTGRTLPALSPQAPAYRHITERLHAHGRRSRRAG